MAQKIGKGHSSLVYDRLPIWFRFRAISERFLGGRLSRDRWTVDQRLGARKIRNSQIPLLAWGLGLDGVTKPAGAASSAVPLTATRPTSTLT